MAFRFSLQAVLRLRRGQQHQQELLVQRASEQVTRAANELRGIEIELARVFSDRHTLESLGAELHFKHAHQQVLEERRREIQVKLAKAREQHSRLLAELRKTWQQCEILEAARKREHEAYLVEQARREQAMQDDLFLLRGRSRKHVPS